MSLARLKGGIVYDPANGVNGERRDVYFRDGRIVDNAAERPRRRRLRRARAWS